jgi:hypothetical protein
LKHLRDDLVVLHLLAEGGEVRRHVAQAQRVVLDGLIVIECGEVELPMQLLHHHLLHAVIADLHGRDCVPGLLGRLLLSDRQHHLQWYHATQCIKRHHLLLLIGAAILDDAPESHAFNFTFIRSAQSE